MQHRRMTGKTIGILLGAAISLITPTAAVSQSQDLEEEQRWQEWVREQPPEKQGELDAMMAGWRACVAHFQAADPKRDAIAEAAREEPRFYSLASGGVRSILSVPGVCENIDTRNRRHKRELDAAMSSPQDGMGHGPPSARRCFAAATRYAAEFNRALVRGRSRMAREACRPVR